MDVAIAYPAPIDELDAEFERPLRLLDEFNFVDFQDLIEQLEVRHRGFAHAHGADLLGFDQAYRMTGAQHLRQGGGGHPARCAAADDDNVPYMAVSHHVPFELSTHGQLERARHAVDVALVVVDHRIRIRLAVRAEIQDGVRIVLI